MPVNYWTHTGPYSEVRTKKFCMGPYGSEKIFDKLIGRALKISKVLFAVAIGALILSPLYPASTEVEKLAWIKGFKKYDFNPILLPQGTTFEAKATFNPAVILHDSIFYMLYRAEAWYPKECGGQSSIGLAKSEDGINFTRKEKPVITPEKDYELPGGCEDPRIVKIGDTYFVTYTGYNSNGTPSCLAASKDLIHWQKYGPITPRKSAAILNIPINGKYWLYFGDTNIWAAYSTDLIHWEVINQPVLRPRKGYFDEAIVEPGPPPVITKDGILLIYNGNIPEEKAKELGRDEGRTRFREYSAGWAIFSYQDPTKLVARCSRPFLRPTKYFEKIGQDDDVVFAEGLVKKNGKSYLYYGCADTYIGVAMSEQTWQEPSVIQIAPYAWKIASPILQPLAESCGQGKGFECNRVYNPTVICENGTIYMIYRAGGRDTGTGAFGLAQSKDGINFTRYKNNPIMISEYDFERDGCEDPRIVRFGDTYYLFYDGSEPIYEKPETTTPGNICLATSKDLIHWKKYGEILQPKYDWESGQIKAPAPVPEKINGKYWMYYQGEITPWGTKMGLAYSEDLIHWAQISERPIMMPREGYFDSWGTEPGVAVVIDEGIFLIYNGWGGDGTNINKTGWALFNKKDPTELLERCEAPFIYFPADHVFTEGLVKFKDKWYLYYGAADEWIEGMIVNIKQLLSEKG